MKQALRDERKRREAAMRAERVDQHRNRNRVPPQQAAKRREEEAQRKLAQ
jgi:hypothetical protein